jgi:D-lactate dehydrogenase (cytochrome)
MLRDAEGVDLTDQPTLFMEFHAAQETSLQAGMEMVREICEEMGASRFYSTTDPAARKKLWHARHASFEIMVRKFPNTKFYIMDVAVPISAYPELISYVEQVKREHDVTAFMIGHAGDGNIHVEFPYKTYEEYQKRAELNNLIVLKAISLHGTATGEHGVGIGKTQFMNTEHGPAVDVMRSIKNLLDPNGILNPGKIFPNV